MSGIFDTVIVILVPGGPDAGVMVIVGLGSTLRSEVAHTELIGRRIIIMTKRSAFNLI